MSKIVLEEDELNLKMLNGVCKVVSYLPRNTWFTSNYFGNSYEELMNSKSDLFREYPELAITIHDVPNFSQNMATKFAVCLNILYTFGILETRVKVIGHGYFKGYFITEYYLPKGMSTYDQNKRTEYYNVLMGSN